MLSLSVPLICSAAAKLTQQGVVSVMLGREGHGREATVLLAGVSASAIWTAWTDGMLMAGNSQLAALCSQAMGARSYPLAGTWLQIALVNMTMLFLPLVCLRLCTKSVLVWLNVPEDVAAVAGSFTVLSGLPVIFELWYGPVRVYYAAQKIVVPDTVVDFAFIFVTGALVWFFVYFHDWGVIGVAVAISIKRFLRLGVFVGYCWWKGFHAKTWRGWSWPEILVKDRWKLFLRQTVPVMIGGLGEQVHLQGSALIAARLGASSSAAFDLVLCVVFMVYTLSWSVAQATGIRLARCLGQGSTRRATRVAQVGAIWVYVLMAVCGLCFYYGCDHFASFASQDPEVRAEIVSAKVIVPLNFVAFGGLAIMAEILMKQGRPHIAGLTMPLCTWLLGLSAAYVFSIRWRIQGIFWGQFMGYALAQIVLGLTVWHSDWGTLSSRAVANAEIKTK